jgi:hypothetical protein
LKTEYCKTTISKKTFVFVKTKHNIVDDGMSKQWKLEDTIIIAKTWEWFFGLMYALCRSFFITAHS